MLPLKPFYMIRHGQTEHNIAGIAAGGETDSALTAQGRQQPQDLAPYLPKLEIQPGKIFHSSLQRARDTARYLNEALDLEMEEMHDLKEQDLGDWAGLEWQDPQINFKKDMTPPNGETGAQFGARVQRALTYCLEQSEWGKPPLVVCHGGLFFGIGIVYNIYEAMTDIRNCELHYFEPHTDHPYFPWKIIRYEIDGDKLSRSSTPFCATNLPHERSAK